MAQNLILGYYPMVLESKPMGLLDAWGPLDMGTQGAWRPFEESADWSARVSGHFACSLSLFGVFTRYVWICAYFKGPCNLALKLELLPRGTLSTSSSPTKPSCGRVFAITTNIANAHFLWPLLLFDTALRIASAIEKETKRGFIFLTCHPTGCLPLPGRMKRLWKAKTVSFFVCCTPLATSGFSRPPE